MRPWKQIGDNGLSMERPAWGTMLFRLVRRIHLYKRRRADRFRRGKSFVFPGWEHNLEGAVPEAGIASGTAPFIWEKETGRQSVCRPGQVVTVISPAIDRFIHSRI